MSFSMLIGYLYFGSCCNVNSNAHAIGMNDVMHKNKMTTVFKYLIILDPVLQIWIAKLATAIPFLLPPILPRAFKSSFVCEDTDILSNILLNSSEIIFYF